MTIRIKIIIGLVLLLIPSFVLANSMEPPGIVVIIEDGSLVEDVWIEYKGEEINGKEKRYNIEAQYWFFLNGGFGNNSNMKLWIQWSDGIEAYSISEVKRYNTTFTARHGIKNLIEGKSIKRTITLVTGRVMLTLVIEAILFLILGFRKKESWIIFLIMNVITQSALNMYINSFDVASSYPIIALIFGEIWVFIAEGFIVVKLIKEKSRNRRLSFAIYANLLSLIVGGYIIGTWLPI